MRDDKQLIAGGIAREAQHSPEFKRMAEKGLIEFLREQVINAEWKIARAKAEIDAYQQAINAIEKRYGIQH